MKLDKNGGYIYETKEANERAKNADVVTLPPKFDKGINCSNCIYYRKKNETKGDCLHKEVMLPVTSVMCCSFQDSKGMLRNYNPDGEKET